MNRVLIIILLFWGIAALGLYVIITTHLDIEDSISRGLILIEYSNPLIKFSLSIAMFLGSLGFFLLPIISIKTNIALGSDYYEGDKLAKARSNFILISIFLPAILFFLLMYYYSEMSFKDIRFLLVSGFFSFTYLDSIFKLLSSKKER